MLRFIKLPVLGLWCRYGGMMILSLSWQAHALSGPGVLAKAFNQGAEADHPVNVDIVSDPALLLKELRQKLAETKAEIARNEEDLSQDVDKPMVNADAFPRSLFAQIIVHAIEVEIRSVEEVQVQRQRFMEWQRTAQNQSGVVKSYISPFLESDQLRDNVLKGEKQIVRLEQILSLVKQDLERRIQATELSSIKLRQNDEELDRSRGIQKAQLNEKHVELALRHRFNWIRMIAEQVEIQYIQQELKEVRSKRAIAEVRQATIGDLAKMTDSDLERITFDIRAERHAILKNIQTDIAHLNTLSSKQDTAENQQVVRESVEWHLQSLESLLHFLQIRQMTWESRRAFVSMYDKAKLREFYDQILYWMQDTRVYREYLELRLWENLHLASENGSAMPVNKTSRNLQGANMEQINMYLRMIGALDTNESLLLRYKQDVENRVQVKTASERWYERWLKVQKVLFGIWSYELFVAEDAVEVDGQLVKGQRSITVNKVVSALLILIFGCWLACIVARFMEKLAITRLAVDPYQARIVRRWFMFIEIAIVVIISLMMVHIPLTVFAFMGGAVAIGAGFGMQNLLKNLISGLMLLLERPFRLGDLVEVGGVRGRIIDVGIRSSQIRAGNGIETLIPNSVFIEEQVTNWTLSSQSVRITLNVRVAYDASVQVVTNILLESAERHGLVQDKPPPQVLFEDFGEDGLMFCLRFWLELSPEVDSQLVTSDLRYIINKRFVAEGIAFAVRTHVVSAHVSN